MTDGPLANLPTLPEKPGVSYVMPVLNEAGHIAHAIQAILDQDYDGEKEVIVAVGESHDGTSEIVAEIAARDPRVTLVPNPESVTPVGMNLAVAASRHPVIIRVDAHSEIPRDYTSNAVRILRETGAANVGGLMLAQGKTAFQKAVARVYMSKVGLGGPSYHAGDKAQPADSAYLGVFRREVWEELSGMDPRLRRGQDWELNLRIRQAGGLVWFDPTLHVVYWPRTTLKRVAQQFYAGGIWRADLIRMYGANNPPRYFAAPALVLGLAAATGYTAASLTGTTKRWSWPLRWMGRAALAGAGSYAALIAAVTAQAKDCSAKERLWFAVALPTVHLSWGAGFLRGLVTGGGDTVDRGRSAGGNRSKRSKKLR